MKVARLTRLKVSAGALLALAALMPLLMAPTGGLPQFPTFGGITTASGANTWFKVDSVGNITAPNALSVPWGAAQTTGTQTGSVVGCTTTPTPAIRWIKSGNEVTIYIPNFTCTSNAIGFSITSAIPVALEPTVSQQGYLSLVDNAVTIFGCMRLDPASQTIFFQTTAACNNNSFTVTGTKGSNSSSIVFPFTYALN